MGLPFGASAPDSRVTGQRRRVRARSRGKEQLGIALLAMSLSGSALVFGGQQTPVLVLAALAAAAAAWLLRASTSSRAVWLPLGLAIYTLFQIVPLPLSWVAALSPASAAVWQGALRPFAAPPPSWVTLSVDPAATALEALKWFSYGCIFIAAAGWRARRGTAQLALLIFGCGALVALVTLAHGVLGLQRIYGMYTAPTPSPWLRGPFVNGNNLAGYVNLGLFAGVGLWLSPERKVPAWPLLLGVPVMVAQVLLSESRGGIGCLLLGLLWIGFRSLRRRRLGSPRLHAGIPAAFALGLAAAAAIGWARLAAAFSDRDAHAKVSAWRWSLDLIKDFPTFGVGRGAFETAFEPYRRLLGNDWTMVFAYAENFPLQWAADWGVLVAVLALAAAVVLGWRPVSRAMNDPLAGSLVAGLGALLLQNLVDLGLEIFAVSALAVVAFAALGGSSSTERRGPVLDAIAISGVLVSTVIVLAIGAVPVRIERQRVSNAYSAWVRNGSKDPVGFLAMLRAPMLRHPGEAYFPLVGSIPAARAGGDPLRWIGRALERSPLDGQAHLRLADVMASRGARRQALFHLRLAAVYDGILRDHALWKASGLARSSEDLLSAFPPDQPGARLLPELCRKAVGSVQIACWREVVARDTNDSRAKRELARGLLEVLEGAAEPCLGLRVLECKKELRVRLGEAQAVLKDWQVMELRARELAMEGNLRDATALLLEHCPATREAAACCQRAVEVARRAKDLSLLGTAADRYTAAVCYDPRSCALAHELIGRSYAELSAVGLASRHFMKAAEQEPSPDRWLQSAEAAARAGATSAARVAFDRARREGTLSAEQQRRVEAVKTMLDGIPRPN